MKKISTTPNRQAATGISLVEILASLALFSTAMVGIYMSVNAMNSALNKAVQRDIEAAYANMKLAEVNPYDIDIETAYDQTSKQTVTLPTGEQFWWTRIVDSASTSADVKRINVYLFRNSTDSTPYRQFKREIALERANYMMRCNTVGSIPWISRDPSGNIWSPIKQTASAASITSGSVKAGTRVSATGCGSDSTAITGAFEAKTGGTVSKYQTAWQQYHLGSTGTALQYRFPVTQGQNYTVQLGFSEPDNSVSNGQRIINVSINSAQVDTVDPMADASARHTALTRTYVVTPTLSGSVPVIDIDLAQNGSATQPPVLSWISISRNTDL